MPNSYDTSAQGMAREGAKEAQEKSMRERGHPKGASGAYRDQGETQVNANTIASRAINKPAPGHNRPVSETQS